MLTLVKRPIQSNRGKVSSHSLNLLLTHGFGLGLATSPMTCSSKSSRILLYASACQTGSCDFHSKKQLGDRRPLQKANNRASLYKHVHKRLQLKGKTTFQQFSLSNHFQGMYVYICNCIVIYVSLLFWNRPLVLVIIWINLEGIIRAEVCTKCERILRVAVCSIRGWGILPLGRQEWCLCAWWLSKGCRSRRSHTFWKGTWLLGGHFICQFTWWPLIWCTWRCWGTGGRTTNKSLQLHFARLQDVLGKLILHP